MKTTQPILRTVFSILIVGAAVVGFIMLGENKARKRKPERSALPNVETVIAVDHRGGIEFDVDGVVVPYRQINLAAQVSGQVVMKSNQCRLGRVVKKGDLLMKIDPADYELEVRRLKEELSQADASIGELDAELSSVENRIEAARKELVIEVRQLRRIEDLLKRRAGSESEADTARRAELNTRNALQTLLDEKQLIGRRRIRLKSAKELGEANLDRAELSLRRTEIRSPIDAVVVADNVEQDSYVQTGTEMVTLQDSARLDVTCKLYAKQMNWLRQSQAGFDANSMADQTTADRDNVYHFPETPVTVTYQLGGVRYAWQGVIDRYDGAGVDPQTRMIPCRIHVENPESVTVMPSGDGADATGPMQRVSQPPTLMSGMFVNVIVNAKPPIALVRIPARAVGPGGIVWTVNDGKLKRKVITVATSAGNDVIAYQQSGGLVAGDAIVVSPLASPVDGIQVQEAARQTVPVGAMPTGKPSATSPTLEPTQ
ncbi:Multidrug resistance protein MdtN [Rubripirellula obstinata]|uniref:Multidrug resistance protein MdtN n=1 Tax=Rubripirellula obstinata TaxID=406547 RepID=A0A5B1CIC8_9BACT|nr:HlyD family efflux transporter periplasmic adaptor subunit [Rubripirellula obstinata]KAA1259992.1 Multidrug resistance protein MdtN [Rubripirellula obstinata]